MYVQWILGVPQNLNFSFEKDSNNDGIPDGWIGDSDYCQRYEDFNCPHGFGIDHTTTTSEVFDSRGGASKLSFKYKFVEVGNVSITLNSGVGQIYTDTINMVDFDWNFYEVEVPISFSGNIWFIISCLNSEIIIEDLVLTHNNLFQSFTVNPTVFEDDRKIIEEVVHTINDEKFLIKPILFNYSQSIMNTTFLYINRIQLDFLKGLSRKKIIIRMSDDRMLACRVIRIEEEYVEGEQGQCQNYSVRMSFEKI